MKPPDEEAREGRDLDATEEFWRWLATLTDDDVLTLPEAAAMARMPVNTFRYVLYHGQDHPAGFRMGKKRVFRKGEIREWMKALEAAQHPGAQAGAA